MNICFFFNIVIFSLTWPQVKNILSGIYHSKQTRLLHKVKWLEYCVTYSISPRFIKRTLGDLALKIRLVWIMMRIKFEIFQGINKDDQAFSITYLQLLLHVAKLFVQCLTHQFPRPTCILHLRRPIVAVLCHLYLSGVRSCKILPMRHPSDPGTTYPGCLQCISDQQ